MVTFNRLNLTKETLNSILTQTKTPYQLVLVDNASVDSTVKYLKEFCTEHCGKNEFFRSYKIIENKENLGIATGRNQALLASEGEWLSTLDNDVLLPDNWLGQCIDILSKNKRYGMVGVNFEPTKYPLIKLNDIEFQRKAQGNLGTACTVFHRSLHKLLGFFNNKDYSKFYGIEDSDWGMRVRVLGFEMGYLKENGTHLGEGEQDKGEYRKFKDKCHQEGLAKFNQNCRDYHNKRKPIYFSFKSEDAN